MAIECDYRKLIVGADATESVKRISGEAACSSANPLPAFVCADIPAFTRGTHMESTTYETLTVGVDDRLPSSRSELAMSCDVCMASQNARLGAARADPLGTSRRKRDAAAGLAGSAPAEQSR